MSQRRSCWLLLLAIPSIAHAQSAPIDPPPAAMPAPDDPATVDPAPPPPEAMPPMPPEPPPAKDPKSNPVRVTYDKALAFADEAGQLAVKLSFRNQLRLESTRPTEDGSQFASRFLIPRSRLQVEGHVLGPDNRYKLELGLGDAGSFSFVKDLYIDKRLGSSVWLRTGQWKRPFNRQELVSDFASELNERANTAAFVGGGRDLGIAIHNDYEKSPDGLEWVIGVFNGFSGGADRPVFGTSCTQNPTTGAISCSSGAPTNFPADFGPTVVVRAGWNTGGIKGYSEGDLEGGPLRLAIGASYKIDLANLTDGTQASYADNLSHGAQVDAMIKVSGLGVLLGGYVTKLKAADAQLGVLAQAGYFVVPQKTQVALRFAYAPPAVNATREQLEVRAAFNWFWEGHRWKWANDVGVLKLSGEDPTTMATDDPDVQVRSMLQLTF
jgi:hypothetical protein